MKETIIRPMNYDDLNRVITIEQEVFSDPWEKVMFLQELEADSAYIMETKDGQETIGYICGIKVLDEYMITNIAIKREEQHKGYGTLLLQHLIREIVREGCQKCFLEVRASNKKAITFYLNHGFETIGRRKEYYHKPVEDALVMKIELLSSNKPFN